MPTPGAGTPARATVSWREMFPKMSAGPWEAEGGEIAGGGGGQGAPPPPLLRPPGLPAGACGTCGGPPATPPLALALSLGGVRGGGAARAAGAPPAHPAYPSRSGCVPPPSRREGGGRKAPPGGARTRATSGAHVALLAPVMRTASGSACGRAVDPARAVKPPPARPRPAAPAAATPATLAPPRALAPHPCGALRAPAGSSALLHVATARPAPPSPALCRLRCTCLRGNR